MSELLDTMRSNLESTTGHDLEWWIGEARGSGFTKHGEMVAALKTRHGLTHGYANFVVHAARQRTEGVATPAELVDAQYAGREHLRPIYEAVVAVVREFGDDVEVVAKKTGVSLRRSKQFALIQPATKSRVDLGLNLGDQEPTGRLHASKGMCTHRLGITDMAAADDEVRRWLRHAYERA